MTSHALVSREQAEEMLSRIESPLFRNAHSMHTEYAVVLASAYLALLDHVRKLEDVVQWALDEGGWRLIYYSDDPPHNLVNTGDMFGSRVNRWEAALSHPGSEEES